jgi:hypothetical protein
MPISSFWLKQPLLPFINVSSKSPQQLQHPRRQDERRLLGRLPPLFYVAQMGRDAI